MTSTLPGRTGPRPDQDVSEETVARTGPRPEPASGWRSAVRHTTAPIRRRLAPVGRVVGEAWRTVTPFGRAVAVTGVLAWIAGAELGWRELLILAAACLVLVIIAIAFTVGRANVQVAFTLQPPRVTVGTPAAGEVRITNVAGRRLLPIRLELRVGSATALFDLPSLGGGQTHEELFVVPTHKRAVIPVGPATTVRGDPLGLMRRAVEWTEVAELFVHPRIALLDTLGAGFLRDLEGRSTNDVSMSDLAFHALRDYVPGDDRRYVHWKSTARTGRLLVRQFVDTRRTHVTVVIDGDPASYPVADDFELAISIGGSIAVRTLRDEQDSTLVAAGRVAPGRTPRQVLDELARVEPAPGALGALVTDALNVAPDTSLAVLVTGAGREFTDVRRAAALIPSEVRTLVCTADSSSRAGLSSAEQLTVLTVSGLGDLAGMLRAVGAPR